MEILKLFLAGCGVVAGFVLTYQIILCFEYDEWRKVYIPVSKAFGDSINRVKLLENLIEGMGNPTMADIKEYKEALCKMRSLAAEADRIWTLNPRRVNGERPASFIDTVKRLFRKKSKGRPD